MKTLRDYEVYLDFTNDAVYVETESYREDLTLELFKKLAIKEFENENSVKLTDRFYNYMENLEEIRDFRVFLDGFTEDADCNYLVFIDDDTIINRDKNANWYYYHSDDFYLHSMITIKNGFEKTIFQYNRDIIIILEDDLNILDDFESIENIISKIENNESKINLNDITFKLIESGGVDCFGRIEDLKDIRCQEDFNELEIGILGVVTESPYGSSIIVYTD